jgi:hypothetical protein
MQAIKNLLPRALELYRGSTLGKDSPTPGAEVAVKDKAMALEHDLVGGKSKKKKVAGPVEQKAEPLSKDSNVDKDASSEKVAVAA